MEVRLLTAAWKNPPLEHPLCVGPPGDKRYDGDTYIDPNVEDLRLPDCWVWIEDRNPHVSHVDPLGTYCPAI